MEKVSYNPFMHSLPVIITMPEINDMGNLFSYQLNEIQYIHTFEKKKKELHPIIFRDGLSIGTSS